MLVFDYDVLNDNLSKTFGEVTWKYKIDELINKVNNTLNELINRSDLPVKTIELSNELLEILKVLENCTNCKGNTGKCNLNGIHESINEIEKRLSGLEKEQGKKKDTIRGLNNELFEINIRLNKEMLCE